jgi:hypothetical protein
MQLIKLSMGLASENVRGNFEFHKRASIETRIAATLECLEKWWRIRPMP